jgi:hypothetical protein
MATEIIIIIVSNFIMSFMTREGEREKFVKFQW